MTHRKPIFPQGGLIAPNGQLTTPGGRYLEEVGHQIGAISDALADSETGTLGALATKDTITKAELAPDFATLILQRVEIASETATITLGAMPADGTIPQISEGGECMSGTFTPLSETSTVEIEVQTHLGAGATSILTTALYKDGAADAIAAACSYGVGAGAPAINNFRHVIAPGSTDEITFSVRAGANSGTPYLNGWASGDFVGGILRSSIVVTEYEVI